LWDEEPGALRAVAGQRQLRELQGGVAAG